MRNFVDEFNVKLDKSNEYENVTDYEAFPNKNSGVMITPLFSKSLFTSQPQGV